MQDSIGKVELPKLHTYFRCMNLLELCMSVVLFLGSIIFVKRRLLDTISLLTKDVKTKSQ